MDKDTEVFSAMVIVKKVDVEKCGAHWTPVTEDDYPLFREYEDPAQIGWATCSECGVLVDSCGMVNGYRYCPICGAEMGRK